jgi:hypothetical protein
MVNQFPEAGQSRGRFITWAREITEEAFRLDPIFMDEAAGRIFGGSVWCWTAAHATDAKIHAICRAAMIVRLQAGAA